MLSERHGHAAVHVVAGAAKLTTAMISSGRSGSTATSAKRFIPSTFVKYPAFLSLSSSLAAKKRK